MFACSLQLSTAKLQCPNNPRRQDNIILIRFTDFNTTHSDLFRNFAALAAEAGASKERVDGATAHVDQPKETTGKTELPPQSRAEMSQMTNDK